MEVGVEGDNRVVRGLRNLEADGPDIAEAQASKIAEFFAEEIRKNIRNKLSWTGKLSQSVRISQRRAGGRFASGFEVSINAPMENGRGDYAAWNEFARTGHWVSITPENYPINEWADDVGLPESVGAIFVTPQPFMSSAVRRGIRRMSSFVEGGGTVQDFINKNIG